MLTIFTPTYNRGYILERLYKSLINQTNKNFEWVIVDDGSIDNTKKLVEKWINNKQIKIKYFYQENSGKSSAHNLGVMKAEGDFFTCVDSDDFLTEEAVDIILKYKEKIIIDKTCVGMVGNRCTIDKKIIGTDMPKNIKFTTLYDLYNKYKHKGDTILVYKTKEIKKYKFPKIDGEKFIPETYIYDKIDQDGKLLIIQEKLYICEYLEDGYTKNAKNLIKNNPQGYILYAKQRIKLAKGFNEKVRASAQYVLGNKLLGNKKYIKESPSKILTIISIPLANIFYYKNYKG